MNEISRGIFVIECDESLEIYAKRSGRLQSSVYLRMVMNHEITNVHGHLNIYSNRRMWCDPTGLSAKDVNELP